MAYGQTYVIEPAESGWAAALRPAAIRVSSAISPKPRPMKLLTAAQTRQADAATIAQEGIRSVDLMERAATAFTAWLTQRLSPAEAGEVLVLCGPGNNGGDGLVAARLLHARGYRVRVGLLPADQRSADFEHNRQHLPAEVPVAEWGPAQLPPIAPGTVVIDALFGTGLSRPLEGAAAALVQHLNGSRARVVSIDLPSGLFADAPQPPDSAVVEARHTVTFQLPKLALLLPQNARYVGRWHALPIGLSPQFLADVETPMHLVDASLLAGRLPARPTFARPGPGLGINRDRAVGGSGRSAG